MYERVYIYIYCKWWIDVYNHTWIGDLKMKFELIYMAWWKPTEKLSVNVCKFVLACDTGDNCQNKNITLAANPTHPPPQKKWMLRKYSTKTWFQHQSVQTQTSTALFIRTCERLLVESSGLHPTLPIETSRSWGTPKPPRSVRRCVRTLHGWWWRSWKRRRTVPSAAWRGGCKRPFFFCWCVVAELWFWWRVVRPLLRDLVFFLLGWGWESCPL